MSQEIARWMSYLDNRPSVKLFEHDLPPIEKENELIFISKEEIEKHNPLDVVLESLYNVISEQKSVEHFTDSADKIVMSNNVKNLALDEILTYLKENRSEKLQHIHEAWLIKLRTYLISAHKLSGNLKIDEVIYRVGEDFRISGSSAIKAINTIASVNFR